MSPVTPRPPTPSAALREIGGRLKKLTFREMQTLVSIMHSDGFALSDRAGADGIADRLLKVAAVLEQA